MARTVSDLIGSSVDDLRTTLYHVDDIGLLRQGLQEAIKYNLSTKALLIQRRIKVLQKGGKG